MAMTVWYGETKQVPFRVQGTNLSDSAPIDPSGSALTCGFVAAGAGDDGPSIWYPGTWDADSSLNNYWGQILVGPSPGVYLLPRGTWSVWAKFTVGVETIIQPVLDTLYCR
jgi:hypothetical protein